MRIFQVDAFSAEPFGGSPAAVCLLDAPRPDTWMQAVAAEMALSETAFLPTPGARDHEGDPIGLRWFAPAAEVDLCGHATLATAHVLWEELGSIAPELRFSTRSGELRAWRRDSMIWLDFPSWPPVGAEAPVGLAEALGAEPVWTGHAGTDFLVEVADRSAVAALAPDLRAIGRLPFRCVVVTAPAGEGDDADFVSRVFGPAVGIDEDPVTGSTHCALGPYWAPRLGRQELVGRQLSARGGRVAVRVAGAGVAGDDVGDDRVHIGGPAVIVLRGQLADGA